MPQRHHGFYYGPNFLLFVRNCAPTNRIQDPPVFFHSIFPLCTWFEDTRFGTCRTAESPAYFQRLKTHAAKSRFCYEHDRYAYIIISCQSVHIASMLPYSHKHYAHTDNHVSNDRSIWEHHFYMFMYAWICIHMHTNSLCLLSLSLSLSLTRPDILYVRIKHTHIFGMLPTHART